MKATAEETALLGGSFFIDKREKICYNYPNANLIPFCLLQKDV